MTIERLPFNDPSFPYHPMETAIHVARYQIARSFVFGKRVLDIACGEGYGSWLMKQWGADRVIGVDLSREAIQNAEKYFSHPDIEFVYEDAQFINWNDSFDVIVSLETIEHVADEKKFLEKIKRLLRPDGIIIISCPNDEGAAWTDNETNPYHLKRYTLESFMKVTESILGSTEHWLIGSNVFGYANLPYDKKQGMLSWHKSELLNTDAVSLQQAQFDLCHNEFTSLPNKEACIYYIGIWAGESIEQVFNGTVFPIKPLNADINTIKTHYQSLHRHSVTLQESVNQLQKEKNRHEEIILRMERELFTVKQREMLAYALQNQQQLIDSYIHERIEDMPMEIKNHLLLTLQKESLSSKQCVAERVNDHELSQTALVEKIRFQEEVIIFLKKQQRATEERFENTFNDLKETQKKLDETIFLLKNTKKFLDRSRLALSLTENKLRKIETNLRQAKSVLFLFFNILIGHENMLLFVRENVKQVNANRFKQIGWLVVSPFIKRKKIRS